MSSQQPGNGGGGEPSVVRAGQHLPALQPVRDATQDGRTSALSPISAQNRSQQPVSDSLRAGTGATEASVARPADGAAPVATTHCALHQSRISEEHSAEVVNAGASSPVVGLEALLQRAEQCSRLVFSLQVAEPLMRTAQQFQRLNQAFTDSLGAACGGHAAVEEVAVVPKPEQRGVRTVNLLAYVKQRAADQLCARLKAGAGGIQVSVADADVPCLAMLHTGAPASRPLFLFTLETSSARYPPDALMAFVQENRALFGGIQVQWMGRVDLTGHLITNRVDAHGQRMSEIGSPAYFPGTVIGLAVGGQGILREEIAVPLPGMHAPQVAAASPRQPRTAQRMETFLMRRVPNRATDTPPQRWHRSMLRGAARDASHIIHTQATNQAPSATIMRQAPVSSPAAAAATAAPRLPARACTLPTTHTTAPPVRPDPVPSEASPVGPSRNMGTRSPATQAPLSPRTAPLSHTQGTNTPASPSLPRTTPQLTEATRTGRAVAPLAPHTPARTLVPFTSSELPPRQLLPVPFPQPQQMEIEENALAIVPAGSGRGLAQPLMSGGMRGELSVSGDMSRPSNEQRARPEMLACGSWVELGGAPNQPTSKVGLVVAYVWCERQRRLLPRVVMGEQSVPAWRDVAASALRVVDVERVPLRARQVVSQAIQQHGEALFEPATFAVTDWHGVGVVFSEGYMPPTAGNQVRRSRRTVMQLEPAHPPAAGVRRPRPLGARVARQPHTKLQRCRSKDDFAMDSATEDSTYADNASLAGSEADELQACLRYEGTEPTTRPDSLVLALPAPPAARDGWQST